MKPALTQERIERAVSAAARAFEVPPREIAGRCNIRSVSRARQAMWKALYEACFTSYPEMAWLLNRNHSTIIDGVKKADAMSADPDYADRVRLIKAAALGIGDMRRAA